MTHPGITYLDETTTGVARCNRRKASIFGVLGCIFSVLGIFTLGIASPVGLGLSMLGMTRRPRGAAVCGAVLGLLGTAFLLIWSFMVVAGITAVEHAVMSDQTEVKMQQGIELIETFRFEHRELPDGIAGNKVLLASELTDAWDTALRYDLTDDDTYAVRSAGPDKQFDTHDDLIRQ